MQFEYWKNSKEKEVLKEAVGKMEQHGLAGKDDTFKKDFEEEHHQHEIIGTTQLSRLAREGTTTMDFLKKKLREANDRLSTVQGGLRKTIDQYSNILAIYEDIEEKEKKDDLLKIFEEIVPEIQESIASLEKEKDSLNEKVYNLTLRVDSFNSDKN